MSTLSVHLVTWNGEKYLPYLFESLRNQTLSDWELVVLDNGSSDNTLEILQKEIRTLKIKNRLLENHENLGFAIAHNQIFKKTNSVYFLLLNQDIYLEKDCLEKIKIFLENNIKLGSASPRLMRWNFEKIKSSSFQDSLTNEIDAVGLKIFRNRRIIEWLTKQSWEKNNKNILKIMNKKSVQVFGVSGACPIYRRSAIEEVCFNNKEMFDENYGSYKEDVDLAYRLRSAGFLSEVLLDALVWHDRTGAGPKKLSDSFALKNKRNQSNFVKYFSYKNHIQTLIKNEYWQNFILDIFHILWYEKKKFIFFLLFDREVLNGLKDIYKNWQNILNKRKIIKSKRMIRWREMRKMFKQYE